MLFVYSFYPFQIWFLPLGIHAVTRTILNQDTFQKCAQKANNQTSTDNDAMFERKNISPKIDSGVEKRSQAPPLPPKPKIDTGLRKKAPPLLPPKPKVDSGLTRKAPLLPPKPKVDSGLIRKAPSPLPPTKVNNCCTSCSECTESLVGFK